MKFLTLFISLFTLLFMDGCSGKWNPFSPPSGTYSGSYDPLPVQEPIRSKGMYKATMKPYTVRGVKYYPIVPTIGETFRGIASWYGPNFHGGKTSNGEYYDMNSLTAAHKTLPMNTLVKVTNLKNGASTIVRINDRGPFVSGRIIDLSHQAAQEIDMLHSGIANVELEVVDVDGRVSQSKPAPTKQIEDDKSVHYGVSKELYDEYGRVIHDAPAHKFKPKLTLDDLDKAKQTYINEKTTSTSVDGYKIQILSTNSQQKATAIVKKYATIDDKYHTTMKTKSFSGRKFYRVLVGDFKDSRSAKNFITSHGLSGAFIVKD